MSIGETVLTVAQNPATHVTAALVAGTLLQRVFNVVGIVAGFFSAKPDLSKDILAVLTDLKNGQDAIPDILKALQDLKANAPKAS
jgi:hypothetical protein